MAYSDLELILFFHGLAARELASMRRKGVRFVIVHRHVREPELGVCEPGESVAALWLFYNGRQFEIPLGVPHLLLVDWLARQRRPRSAAQIAEAMNSNRFYTLHGTNAHGHNAKPARISRGYVRKLVERIRKALKEFFEEEGLNLDPWEIIRSRETSTRETKYLLVATVTWEDEDTHFVHRPFDTFASRRRVT